MLKSSYFYKILLISILFFFLSYEVNLLVQNVKKIRILEKRNDRSFIQKRAEEIYTQCHALGRRSSPCYLERFEAFTKKYNIKTAVAVLSMVQDFDEATKNCHLIAHKIASSEVKKGHPWQEFLKMIDPYFCTGGFVHGVLEAAVSRDSLSLLEDSSPDLLCNTAYRDEFPRIACVHALGHIILTEANGDISDAVSVCYKAKDETNRHNCFAGVFMENITRLNLETHGVASQVPPSTEFAESVENVCKSFPSVPQHACWQELAHLYLKIYGDDPTLTFQACNRASEKAMARSCYMHAAGMMAVADSLNPTELDKICRKYEIENPLYQRCLYSVIDALLISSPKFLSRATSLCERAPQFLKNQCLVRINSGIPNNIPKNSIKSVL